MPTGFVTQLGVTSLDRVPDVNKVAIGEKERMRDDEVQQLPKIHPVDLIDDVILIAHAEILRRVTQIENLRGRCRCRRNNGIRRESLRRQSSAQGGAG